MSNQRIRNKKIVYVAMSGGVDSSVAAALLKKRGFSIVGVFMKPWSPSGRSPVGRQLTCLWKEDREDAMRTASTLGIPLLTWDFSKQYKKAVTDYMIREYKAGRTPNPDVMCNREIKFGIFFEKAIKEGADFIATGHYIRKAQSVKRGAYKRNSCAIRYTLHIARDSNKDQSYFLWMLKQKQLKKCLFPIGEYAKPEVRKLAKKFGLPNHAKKDSQGVCFIGPLNMKEFLIKYIKPKMGKIILLDDAHSTRSARSGRVVGQHDGIYYYTIGQRHGLDISIGGGPYYVVSKDIKKNIIYIGSEKDLLSKNVKVKDISWVNDKVKLPSSMLIRFRYRANLKRTTLYPGGRLILESPERAITEGQSAVFYRDKELLGGGIIS